MDNNFWLLSSPIAHRGLHNNNLPENSVGAFNNAIENNIPIEMDVQITKDKKLIVFHDKNLARMTGATENCDDLDCSELIKLHLHNSEFCIPTFIDFLKLVDGRVPILIEIKNEGKVGEIEAELIKNLENYKGQFAVQSFNPLSIAYVSKHAPHIYCGLLVCDFSKERMPFYKKFILNRLLLLKKSGSKFLSCKWDELPNKRYIKSKLPLIAWTVQSQEAENTSRKYVQNIIFEKYIPSR